MEFHAALNLPFMDTPNKPGLHLESKPLRRVQKEVTEG